MSDQSLGADCRKALLHPNNSPLAILQWLWPDGDFRGLNAEGIGVILDPRGGEYAERNPSFSCGRKPDGMAVFHRKDGGDKGFNAITLIAETRGIERSEAVKILIQRAGIQETTYKRGSNYGEKSCISSTASLVTERSDAVQKDWADVLLPLEGWQRIEASEDSEECVDIWRRGLAPALKCGFLEAYRFQETSLSPSGRSRQHRLARGLVPGALGFVVHGPEGDPVAIKFRNPGQKEALDAAGVRPYHIPPKGSSAAWCSGASQNFGVGLGKAA